MAEHAMRALANGEFVIVVDRAGQGALVIAAEAVRTRDVAFMTRHTTGVICVAVHERRADQLDLPLMVADDPHGNGKAFTVSVDSVGLSAADRAATIASLADPSTVAADFVRPGHVFPLRARAGGVLAWAGIAEAAVDLARLAGLDPACALSEVVNPDGTRAAGEALQRLADDHGLAMVSIAEVARWRMARETLVDRFSSARIPTVYGEFTAHVYRSALDGQEHVAAVLGEPAGEDAALVRLHSECLTGDLLGSLRCDCGEQLQRALAMIGEHGSGVLLYLRGHEGRGIGLGHKLAAYQLQDQGADTVEANEVLGLPVDAREYGIGAQILRALGVTRVRLMTNNPAKQTALDDYGLDVVERVPLVSAPNLENVRYLSTKQARLGHLLDLQI